VQELGAELANQRAVAGSLKDALATAQTQIEAGSAVKTLHDVAALRAEMEVRRTWPAAGCLKL